MNLLLSKINNIQPATIQVTGSKSETNRLLLLQALFPGISLSNVSDSDDSRAMTMALSSAEETIDIHHAGTAMRFLTAFFSATPGRAVILTGSDRMKQRPIGILAEALMSLGADISYLGQPGYPPLKIIGRKLTRSSVSLKADVSSQFISALLLIAPALENGLMLKLEGKITSIPYIELTLSLLRQAGVRSEFSGSEIRVWPKAIADVTLEVESDWSSASYFYSIVALSEVGTEISLNSYRKDSFQGDSALVTLYEDFGVVSEFENHQLRIRKTSEPKKSIRFDLNDTPDIAQTIAVTAFGLGISCDLFGLHTLKIKETDRLEALKSELSKLGAHISVTQDSLHLKPSDAILENIVIETYNDHRMAMAFAPLALRVPLQIADAMVVSKSFPTFWEDLEKLGFVCRGQ